MTQFTGTNVLSANGNTGGAASLVTGTNIWAGGGSAVSTQVAPNATANDFSVANTAGTTVTADDVIIICRRLFQDAGQNNGTARQGEYRLTNCIFQSYNTVVNVNTANNTTTSIIDNCTFYKFDTNYNVVGRWTGGTGLRQQWRNVNWWGRITSAGISGHALFWGNIAADSEFTNLSLWNGQDLITGGAFGGIAQNSSIPAAVGTTFGPCYTLLNGNANAALLVRHAPQGTTGASRQTHAGLVSNSDFRAWEQLESSTNFFMMDIDVAGHVWYVNNLFGRPQITGTAQFGLMNTFNSATVPGGRLQYFTATNPSPGAGADHRYTFSNTNVTPTTLNSPGGGNLSTLRSNGIYLPSTTAYTAYTSSGTDADSTGFLNTVVQDSISNGIFFRQFDYLCTDTVTGDNLNAYRRNARTPPTTDGNRTYRHYAWQQQWPTENASDNNGVPTGPITVTPPSDGAPDDVNRDVTTLPSLTANPDPVNTLVNLTATDGSNAPGLYIQKIRSGARVWESFTGTTVAQARANGFNSYTTAGFQTSHNIEKPADTITTQSDWSTVAIVTADVNTTGGVNQGAAIWAAAKLEAWNRITAANVGNSNAYITMLASYTSPTVNFGDNDVRFDRTASGIGSTSSSITLPTSRLDADDFVNTVNAENFTLSGDINYAETNPKISMIADTSITFSSVGSATTINGLNISAPTINFTTTFTGTMSNLTIGTSTSGAVAITGWNTQQTVTGLTVRSTAGATVTLDHTAGVPTLIDLFGSLDAFSDVSGTITINSDIPTSISLPAGVTPGATVTLANGSVFAQGTNVTFVVPSTHPVQVDLQGIPTGVNWALYVENESAPRFTSFTLTNANGPNAAAEAIQQSDFPNTAFGVTNLTFSSVAGDGTRQQIANLGGTVNELYLMVGNKINAIRTTKLVVNDPGISADQPAPTPQVLTATVFPQSIDPGIGHNGDLHSVSVHSSGTIGAGTVQPAVGDVVVELSNLANDRQATELQTESIWSDARNSFGWFNGIRSQRGTVQGNAASGFVDTYDLFEPNGSGGVVKRVFLTDIATTNSRAGVHVLTGTEFSTDSGTTFGLDQLLSPVRRRLAVPVLVTGATTQERQFIFQQPANLPASTIQDSVGTELTSRGLTRGNLTNVGLNVPIVNEAGDAFETTPTLPTTGG